jgi:selenocysteine-specific elongation factor
MAQGSPTAALVTALEGRGPTSVAELARRANLSEADALTLAAEAVAEGATVPLGDGVLTGATVLLTAGEWTRIAARAQGAVAAFHRASPLRAGMTREELRSRLGLAGNAAQAAIARLVTDGTLAGEGAQVRLPEHAVALTPAQQAQMDTYLAALEAQDFPAEAPAIAPELLALAAEQGRVVRAGQGVVFAAANYQRLTDAIIALARRDGAVTVAGVRDALGASRRYALALLEHLDERKVTRRQGDARVLLEG